MAKKIELNEMTFLINGGGRIDENAPIILQDYVAPVFLEKNAVEIKCAAPSKIRFSKQIGKTVYDVTGLFDRVIAFGAIDLISTAPFSTNTGAT